MGELKEEIVRSEGYGTHPFPALLEYCMLSDVNHDFFGIKKHEHKSRTLSLLQFYMYTRCKELTHRDCFNYKMPTIKRQRKRNRSTVLISV